MTALLTIVFLGGLVGLVKPYIRGFTRKGFMAITLGAFVGIVIVAPKPPGDTNSQASVVADTKTSAVTTANEEVATSSTANTTKWTYTEDKDEMRGTTNRYASIGSENEIDLDSPYGEQRGEITVRRNPESGLNIMFSVGKGQILCNNFTNTSMSVKFDNGPIQKFSCTGTSDGSSETAFFTNESRMLAGLRKAKRTMIEAEFFQKGRQQFKFETAGFVWK